MSFTDDLRKKSNYANSGQMIQDSINETVNRYIVGAVSKAKTVAMEAAKKGAIYISGTYYQLELYHYLSGGYSKKRDYFILDGDDGIKHKYEFVKSGSKKYPIDGSTRYTTMFEKYNFTNEQLRNIGQTICNGITNELRSIGFSNVSVTTIEIPWYTKNFFGTKKPSAEIWDLQYKIYLSWA